MDTKKTSSNSSKLQLERQQQEEKIVNELKRMNMDAKLQDATMTQKGLVAAHVQQQQQQQQQQMEEKKEDVATGAAAVSKQPARAPKSGGGGSNRSSGSNSNDRKNNDQQQEQQQSKKKDGPFAKIQQNIQLAQQGYEQLVHAIIRPPRTSTYQPNDKHLGDSYFSFLGCKFQRQDVTLMTERGLQIVGSHWFQSNKTTNDKDENNNNNNNNDNNTAVIYMHGNASARVEVFQQLSFLLSLGTSVFAFDFALF